VPVTTVAPDSSSDQVSGASPPASIAAAIAGACRSLVSTSSLPPGASHPAASLATRRATASPSAPPSRAISASWSRASAGMNAISDVGTYGALQASTSIRPRTDAGSAAKRSPRCTWPPTRATFRRAHATAAGSRSAACNSAASAATATAMPIAPVPQHRSTITGPVVRCPVVRCTVGVFLAATETRNSLRRRGTNTPGSTSIRSPPNEAHPTTCSSGSPAARRVTSASSSSAVPADEARISASSSANTQPAARSRVTSVGSGTA
jgi:hypothetical protein